MKIRVWMHRIGKRGTYLRAGKRNPYGLRPRMRSYSHAHSRKVRRELPAATRRVQDALVESVRYKCTERLLPMYVHPSLR